MSKKWVSLFILLILSLMITACGTATDEEPATNDGNQEQTPLNEEQNDDLDDDIDDDDGLLDDDHDGEENEDIDDGDDQ